jgi:hypothetical protein
MQNYLYPESLGISAYIYDEQYNYAGDFMVIQNVDMTYLQ